MKKTISKETSTQRTNDATGSSKSTEKIYLIQ